MNGPITGEELNRLGGSFGSPISVVVPDVERPVVLCPELVDLITEAVAMPDTASARAEVIGAMLLRALDAVSWRQGLVGDGGEESSLLRVLREAEAHRQRMAMVPDRF